jgi:threonine dehydrogenase-like Zn-dependent dehydrogenase
VKALQFERSIPRYAAARISGALVPGAGSRFGNLSLAEVDEPGLPGPGWHRVRPRLAGICGSDLASVDGRSSRYFEPIVSFPFVPGHEVVGELDDDGDLGSTNGNGRAGSGQAGTAGGPGRRVVLEPVLGCAARGIDPPCPACASGERDRCERLAFGQLKPGLQTGYCADTGGGWSRVFVAHASQLHRVPDTVDDERAVLVEPLACAIHTVRRAPIPDGASVLVVGAGTVGLLTTMALREYTKAGPIYVIARYGHQRELAREAGATEVLASDRAARALRRATGGFLARPERGSEYLLGGVDLAFDCTAGSGLDTALRVVRAGGTVVMSGMPNAGVDLTPLWFRELNLVGAYCSGGHDFPDALALAQSAPLTGYVDAVYPLSRWRDAIGHASAAGRLGSVKVAFDPTKDQ